MDFQDAGIKHLLWKKSIRNLLDGKEMNQVVEQLSHKDCHLSKWLYAEGIAKHGRINEIVEFETVHIEIHMISNQIIHLYSRGEKSDAETEFKKLEELSKKFVNILTVMALKMSEE